MLYLKTSNRKSVSYAKEDWKLAKVTLNNLLILEPSQENGYIVMVWMVVRLRIDCGLPLAEAFERVVGVMADVETVL